MSKRILSAAVICAGQMGRRIVQIAAQQSSSIRLSDLVAELRSARFRREPEKLFGSKFSIGECIRGRW